MKKNKGLFDIISDFFSPLFRVTKEYTYSKQTSKYGDNSELDKAFDETSKAMSEAMNKLDKTMQELKKVADSMWVCDICKKQMPPNLDEIHYKGKNFCSDKCYREYFSKNTEDEDEKK